MHAQLVLEGLFAREKAKFSLIDARAEKLVDHILQRAGIVEAADGLFLELNQRRSPQVCVRFMRAHQRAESGPSAGGCAPAH